MKKMLLIALSAALCIAMVGCSKQEEDPAQSGASSSVSSSGQTEAAPEETGDPEPQDPAAEEETFTVTGTLDEKKDFMVVVMVEDAPVIFTLEEGVTCEAQVGDQVEVTYTGDIQDMDATLMAQSVTAQP